MESEKRLPRDIRRSENAESDSQPKSTEAVRIVRTVPPMNPLDDSGCLWASVSAAAACIKSAVGSGASRR